MKKLHKTIILWAVCVVGIFLCAYIMISVNNARIEREKATQQEKWNQRMVAAEKRRIEKQVAYAALPPHEIIKEYRNTHGRIGNWNMHDILLTEETVFTVDDEEFEDMIAQFDAYYGEGSRKSTYTIYTTEKARMADVSPIAFGNDPSIYKPLIACGSVGSAEIIKGSSPKKRIYPPSNTGKIYDQSGCSREIPKKTVHDEKSIVEKANEIERQLLNGTFGTPTDCSTVPPVNARAACIKGEVYGQMITDMPEKAVPMLTDKRTEKYVRDLVGQCMCAN